MAASFLIPSLLILLTAVSVAIHIAVCFYCQWRNYIVTTAVSVEI